MCDFFLYWGMGLTFSRNIHNNRVYPFFRYTLAGHRLYQINAGTPCKLYHWDDDKKKVTRLDKLYRTKNDKIDSLRTKINYIIRKYKSNDELLTPNQLRLELNKKELQREDSRVKSWPLLSLIQEWEKEHMNDKHINARTKSKTKSVIKDIKEFIKDLEKRNSKILLINDLNDSFNRELLSWLFNKPNKTGGKLQPYTVARRFRYLQTFCNWYSRKTKEFIKIKIPKELSNALVVSNDEPPLCFYQRELDKLIEFNEFNFMEPFEKDGKTIWVESKKWYKHLSEDRQNRSNKSGVVEFFYEETDYGKQTYTSWEVYLDFLVFLCTTGCRYSDGIRMKVGAYTHSKRRKGSKIRDDLDGLFKYKQIKTNRIATPRIESASIEIYRKYSRGKHDGDYLFPRTNRGNFLSDIKINKHLKSICKAIGLKRKVEKVNLGIKGIELSNDKKELWELVSTHIGRRTYIKTKVLERKYSVKEIMKMTGHKNQNVFNAYYSIEDKDLLKRMNEPYTKESDSQQKVEGSSIPKINNSKGLEELKEKLEGIKKLRDEGLITEQQWKNKQNKLLDAF
jgi:integrase